MASRTTVRTGDIQVKGLAELSRALKALEPALQKELGQTNRDVAATEATHARSAAQSMGGVAAKSAPSISAVGGVRSAGVAFGGASAPWAMGAAFGGQGRPTTMQFQPWVQGGYFPFPQIKDDIEDIERKYVDAVEKLLHKAFPD